MTTPNDALPEPRSEAEIEAHIKECNPDFGPLHYYEWKGLRMELVARRALDELESLKLDLMAASFEKGTERARADRHKNELARERERAERFKKSADGIYRALAEVCETEGVSHAADCPEDDTCECEYVHRIEAAAKAYKEALAHDES